MSMHDLPVGRRRDDQPDFVQTADVSTAPPWDAVLDRLAKLERAHADLARFVTSIHEALPPEIAAATGRNLALGSPIDAVAPAAALAPPPPILGTPPPPHPPRHEAIAPAVDPLAPFYQAPDPWAVPNSGGDSFFEPQESTEFPAVPAARPKRRLFGGRRAAKMAQARIAAEFAAPPPPPGFNAGAFPVEPPPPPPGFDAPSEAGRSVVPPVEWSAVAAPLAPEPPAAAPAFPQGSVEPSGAGSVPISGWFGSDSGNGAPPVPPTHGFSADLAEPYAPASELGWGGRSDLASPTDFEFDVSDAAHAAPSEFGAAVPPPAPPGFGSEILPTPPPPGFGTEASVPPPPMGFGAATAADLTPPPGFGSEAVPPPPPGFGSEAVPPPPPPGFGTEGAAPPPPPGFGSEAAPPPPPPGFGTEGAAPPPNPPGFGSEAVPPPPPPGFGTEEAAPPPPPGFGSEAVPAHAPEVFGDVQAVASLGPETAFGPVPEEDQEVLVSTGTDPVNYAVPPITADFFARSAGKGRR
jgi:hypothetical protein